MLKHMLWGVVMTAGYANSMVPVQEKPSTVQEPSPELARKETGSNYYTQCARCELFTCQGSLPGLDCRKYSLAYLPVSRDDQNISSWRYTWKTGFYNKSNQSRYE
jgi:hypothetical protein